MAATLKRSLHYRMRGKDVKALKRALDRAGYGTGLNDNGVFGLKTQKNLRHFQRDHPKCDKADGVYGKQSHAVMIHVRAKDHRDEMAWDGYCDYLMQHVKLAPSEADKRNRVVSAYMYAYAQRPLHYSMGAGRDDWLHGSRTLSNYPRNTDCSGMCTWCYWVRDYNDPNGLNYNVVGYTGTMVEHGHLVSTPHKGDLIFYGRNSAGDPTHVAMYVGNGLVLSHGSEGGPRLLDQRYRHDRHSMRSYF